MPWPATVGQIVHGRMISPYSAHSIGAVIGAIGAVASTVWPAAQLALYVPFRTAQAIRIAGFFWMNGATVNGNTDCGVYDSGGAKLTSSGATAQAGASAIQSVALGTAIIIPAGVFYLALLSTSATATYFTGPSLTAEEARHIGITDQASAGTSLPATMTRSTPGTGGVPLFGIYSGNAP